MFDRAYRQRLETDLAKWEADGVITPAIGSAIRTALPPLAPGITIAVVIAIVGGLLIAAAFLAFVAAHWTELARLFRVVMLLAGSIAAYGLGGWFARKDEHSVIADLCASVGAIIFGASIALIGQMYHLGGDFAAGMLLWAIGALVAAALTGSRGALAVALVAACTWSCTRISEVRDPHFSFFIVWLLAGGLALAWNSRVAAHLVAAAAIPWWIASALQQPNIELTFVLIDGGALLFGAGLGLAATSGERTSSAGAVLAAYGAISLAVAAGLEVATANDFFQSSSLRTAHPPWALACGVAGLILALAAAFTTRRTGIAYAAGSIGLVLLAMATWTVRPGGEPWLAYALQLCAMISLVISGMLDAVRPRIVAGWIGLAGVIAGITWAVKGSLLGRSAFLAVAGGAAIVLSTALNRWLPRSRP